MLDLLSHPSTIGLPSDLLLSLTVSLGGLGMRAPVGLLIIGMLGAPLLPAVQHPEHTPVLRLAANALLESIRAG
jgi:hypothetical protein